MNGVLWGLGSAGAYGTSDFIARLTSRSIGVRRSLLAMLLTGTVALTVYLWATGFEWSVRGPGVPIVIVAGVLNMIGLLLLYAALTRGPIAVASPIVAAHPALVLILLVPLGIVPNLLQCSAMAVILGAVAFLSRQTGQYENHHEFDRAHIRRTAAIAAAAALFFAVQIVLAQEAAARLGTLQMAWLLRVVALGSLVILMGARREPFAAPVRLVPALVVQGLLDVGGMIFFFTGGVGTDRAVVAVVASTFTAVTVLLARFVLREQVSMRQWGAIAAVMAGVALLAAAG